MSTISSLSQRFRFNFILFAVVLFFSCSENDSPQPEPPQTPEPPEEVEDAYEYLALNSNGEIYSIGDNTGEVNLVGQIEEMRGNLNMHPNAVTSSGEKIYINEHLFDPFQSRIIEYDTETEESLVHNLELPVEVFGENAGLLSLDWDESNERLIAIVREEIEYQFNGKSRVAEINPETMEVTSLNIEIVFNLSHSTALIDQKLYVLSSNQTDFRDAQMLEIDLEAKSLSEFSFSSEAANFAGALGSSGSTGYLFGFSPVSSSHMGEALPVIIDPSGGESISITDLPRISIRHLVRKSFYNSLSGEFVDLVYSSGENLFKLDLSDEVASLVDLGDIDDFSTTTIIVEVREL